MAVLLEEMHEFASRLEFNGVDLTSVVGGVES